MAVGVSDFNETASFEEYNPHPYQGGYDIVFTYGAPLPPSPAICYPISDAASYPPPNPQLPPPPVPAESSASPEADLGYSYGYGEQEFSLDWWWNLSPFMMAADGNRLGGLRYDVEDLRFWGQFRRAADYIFGYSQGFGERRIGEDSLGIPIYAYKKHHSDSVHVEVEPVKTEKLSYHLESPRHERVTLQCSSAYNNNKEEENYIFSNLPNPYMPQEPLGIDPVDGFYNEQMNSERNWISFPYGERRNEVNVYENLGINYSTHYYGGAQNVYLEAVESSYHTLDYPEAFQELSYTDYDRELSYKGHESVSNAYDEGREYEQLSHTELEPYRPSWAQYPGYYGISEDVYFGSQPILDYSELYHESSSPKSLWQTSSIHKWGDEGKSYSSEYAFQTHHDDHSLELEPFKPAWMLNPNYYDTHEEISVPYKPVYFV